MNSRVESQLSAWKHWIRTCVRVWTDTKVVSAGNRRIYTSMDSINLPKDFTTSTGIVREPYLTELARYMAKIGYRVVSDKVSLGMVVPFGIRSILEK